MNIETNKILSAILIACIIFMVTAFIAEGMVEAEPLKENAYKVEGVEVASADTGAAPEKKEITPIGPLLASASAEEGKNVSKKCAACHTFDKGGPNRVGPNLWGIVNNKHAHAEGFAYSSAMQGFDGKWDYESLNKFIYKPAQYLPGTKMVFAGIKNDQERANIIAFLRSLSDSPAPLPK